MRRTLLSARGFSLTEVIITLAIVGILTGMAATPLFSYVTRENMKDQAATVYSVLLKARTLATSRQECAVVTLYPSAYLLTVDTYSSAGSAACTTLVGTPVISAKFNLSPGYNLGNFTPGGTSLIFNTSGGLNSANPVTLQMTDTHTNKKIFTIYPAIGQIRYY